MRLVSEERLYNHLIGCGVQVDSSLLRQALNYATSLLSCHLGVSFDRCGQSDVFHIFDRKGEKQRVPQMLMLSRALVDPDSEMLILQSPIKAMAICDEISGDKTIDFDRGLVSLLVTIPTDYWLEVSYTAAGLS